MLTLDLETLKYPIGKFTAPNEFSQDLMDQWIKTIDLLPMKLKAMVIGMTDHQLDTPYREGGWTVRQVVHHLADSHMNSYIRFKLAVTEDLPVIKPYDEKRWAELSEARHAPVELSLSLLESLHRRWVLFLRSLNDNQWKRKFHHPASGKDIDLGTTLALYAWHCKHHLAHISSLMEREAWNVIAENHG